MLSRNWDGTCGWLAGHWGLITSDVLWSRLIYPIEPEYKNDTDLKDYCSIAIC